VRTPKVKPRPFFFVRVEWLVSVDSGASTYTAN
jgi:hypothetical protein